jgi:endoglucanase
MHLTRRAATGLMLAGLVTPALGRSAPVTVKVPTRGFALPDWLAADARIPATGLLEDLHARGFESIRLPVDPVYVAPATLSSIAAVLTTVTDLGFNAILDLHPAGDVDGDQISLAWDLLGPVLADTPPDKVYAELLNEPPLQPDAWRDLRDRLAGSIRKVAPKHTLIWGPARVQGIWELDATGPLADANSIAAVHYYTPMGFTHQCENWDDSPLARLKQLPFPATRHTAVVEALASTLTPADRKFLDGEFKGPWSTAHIQRDLADLAAWAGKHGTTAMLGEFGVLNFCVDPTSRGRWIHDVRAAAEANAIGWTYWEADQGFGFVADRGATGGVDSAMVEALLA